MLKNKRKYSIALLACTALVGCDDEVKLPLDYEEAVFTVDSTVVGNTKEKYYDAVTSSSDVYKRVVDDILLRIAEIAHDNSGKNGSNVYTLTPDSFKGSVADNDAATYKGKHYGELNAAENVTRRAEDAMVTSVKGGSYTKDNLFLETKYAQYLKDNYYYLDINLDDFESEGKLLTPYLEYEDIFTDSAQYRTYQEKELSNDTKINYLTAEYIYTKSRASIGNSNARKVQIIGLTDRSDEPGAAKNLLNAYIDDYVFGDKVDPDFPVLSRLWKGITKTTADSVKEGRYDDVVLTAEEETWLREKDILPATADRDAAASSTLAGKILEDRTKLELGKTDYNFYDSTLENTYTGSYSYDIGTGVRKAFDDLATQNFVTEGIYLSSSGVESVPSDLSSRIFSPKITTNKNLIKEMQENPGTKKDITLYGKDGFRYLTTADAQSGTNEDIIFYDASSKTYYLTRVLDVVDTASLSETSSTTMYDTAEKKEQISREVAYVMSTTGSYKTNAAVYYLSRTKIKYSDEDFLEYMKTNYKDVFKKENPYTPDKGEEWIDISEVALSSDC